MTIAIFCLSGVAWGAMGLGGPAYGIAPLSGDSIVYTTSEGYKTGTLGIIDSVTGVVSPNLVSNLGGDAVVFSFIKDGESKVFLADRSNGEARIYTPGNWSSPDWNDTLDGNVHGVAATSKDLYISYYGENSGLGWVEKRSLSDDYEVLVSRDITPVVSEDKADAMLSSVDGKVFLLVQGFENFSAWPPVHGNGAIYQLGDDLSVVKSVDIGINPVSLSSWGDQLYVACNGGYNSSSDGAYVVEMTDLSKQTMEFSDFEDPAEYIVGVYRNASRTFVVTSLSDPVTFETVNKIYMADSLVEKTFSNRYLPLDLGTPIAEVEGYLGSITLDEDGDLFVCAGNGTSGTLTGVSSDGSAIVSYSSSSSSSSSGGGCSVGFAPAAILLLAPILLFSKGR